ncbi:MAG: DMT family transporter [Paracoccaceae bacterium]
MNLKSLVMGLIFVFMWSSAFTSAKILVSSSPPLLILGLRFLLTGAIGLSINSIFFKKINLNRNEWKFVLLFGICQNTLYLGLNFLAMNEIDAYLAVIVASLLPIFVAIISFFIKKDKIHFLIIIGIIVGFFGCWIILAPKITLNLNLYGLLLCLIAVIALSIATFIIKDGFSTKEQILPFVSIQMIVGGIPLILLSFIFEDWIINFSNIFIISFIYTCFFPGLIATIIWFNLVKNIGVMMASSFHFLTPPTGVVIAYIVLNEEINNNDILGIIFITIALIIIHQSTNKKHY